MESFPFTEEEWSAVGDAALPVVNAALAHDEALRASYMIGLLDVLSTLRGRYGEHPVLLETEADFTDDDQESIQIYTKAARLAAENGIITWSIRLSLAERLLKANRVREAVGELRACRREMNDAERSDRKQWLALMSECRRRRRSRRP